MKNLFILGVITPQVADIASIVVSLAILIVGYRLTKVSSNIKDGIVAVLEIIKLEEWKVVTWKLLILIVIYEIGTLWFILNGYNPAIVMLTSIWLKIITAMLLILHKEGETQVIPTLFVVGILVVFIILQIQLWLGFAVAFFLGLLIEETLQKPVEKTVKNIKKKLGLS